MKKGILFIALFAASFGFMQSSFAAPLMSANSITNVLAISETMKALIAVRWIIS